VLNDGVQNVGEILLHDGFTDREVRGVDKRHHWPREVDGAALQAGGARLSPLAALTTSRPLAAPWGQCPLSARIRR